MVLTKTPIIALILFLICVCDTDSKSNFTYAVEPSKESANQTNSENKFIYDGGLSSGQKGNDVYTKLLLHPNALLLHPHSPNSTTVFFDSSTRSHSINAFGNVQIDTAQSKLGNFSIFFDGKGDYLTIPDSSDWSFGSGDFTIDFWVRFNTWENGKFHTIVSDMEVTSRTYWVVWMGRNINGVEGISFDAWVDTEQLIQTYQIINGIQANTWYHIAIVRSGNNFYNFINGVQKGGTVVDTSAVPDYVGNAYIGWDGGTYYLDGWLDELRISKGIARWTSNFALPQEPYSSQ